MAKNVFQKKKRVAHLQMCTDDFTKHKNEDKSGCMDILSTIMDNMDSSFKSFNSDYSKLHAKRKCANNDELINSISSTPPSTSQKGVFQYEKKLGKKFTVSRKFPLMEKSQKTLKQIRHNRNISKPRAHLANVPKSPVKGVIEKVPGVKQIKENQKYVSGMKDNPDICSTVLSDTSMCKSNHVHNKNLKKNSCEIKKGKSIASTSLDGHSDNEHLNDADNKLKMNAGVQKNSLSGAKDSENETTDSEYERFVQKNKKGIRKKGVKKQKLSAAKKITSIKKLERVSRKNRLKQYNSDRCDSKDSERLSDNEAPMSENFRKVKCFKKSRISQVHSEEHMESSDGESESDMIADDFTQDPSSESDSESKKTDKTLSLDAKDACSTLQKPDLVYDSDSGSDATLPDVSISKKKTTPETLSVQQLYEHITVDTVKPQSYVPNISSSVVNSSSNLGKTELNYSTSDLVIDLCSDNELDIAVSSEYSSVYVQMEGNNIVKGESIGFSKSHDNCNNTVSKNISLDRSNQEKVLIKDAQNVSNVDSEESDIEIIEIVPTKPKDICIPNVTSNMLECSHSEDSGKEKGQTVENNIGSNISNRNSQIVVKAEKLYETSDVKNQNVKADSNKFKITEIVPTKRKDTDLLNVTSTMLEGSNFEDSGKKKGETVENNIVDNISKINSQLVIKTEKLFETVDIKIQNVRGADSNESEPADLKIQNVRGADNNKFEPAYMTNICNDFNQDKLVSFNQREFLNSECKELPETSSKDILVDGSLLKKDIKQENESDDEVVMLDVVQTASISSHKRVKTKIPNIIVESLKCVKHSADKILKMEIDNLPQNKCDIPQVTEGINMNFKNEHGENLSTQNRFQNKKDPKIENTSSIIGALKSQDVCSSSSIPPTIFSDIKYKENEDCIDLQKTNESHLIELFKKEFDTYQEIVQTEANVSASLKLLEVRQAQKVEYIRSLVQKYIVKDKNSTANSVNKNLKDLPPSCSFPKTDILASSKLDNIKPNISKFDTLENVQHPNVVLKQESESSQKCQNLSEVKSNKNQTLKLLNEKCNVCGKEAMAACQRCAKVFFCSNECGRKFWNDGHINECGK